MVDRLCLEPCRNHRDAGTLCPYCPEAGLIVAGDSLVHDDMAAEGAIRQEYLESLGLCVLRFGTDEVWRKIEGAVEVIWAARWREEVPSPTWLAEGWGASVQREFGAFAWRVPQ